MRYREFTVTPVQDGTRWRVHDAIGAYMVERPSQAAAYAWVDRYVSYLENRVSNRRSVTASPWRTERDKQP